MLVEILTPTLGESISEATIAKLFKKIGESVKKDELIAEIETEKVMLEICSTSDGIISGFNFKEGDTIKTGNVICTIDPKGSISINIEKKIEVEEEKSADKSYGREPSPAAKKTITENNLDESKISGSGKYGQILKEDLMNEKCSNPSNETKIQRVKMSKLRQTIAKRLKDSQNTAAILTTFNEIDMHNVMSLRSQYKDKFEKKHAVKLGFMSFFTKAVVQALKEIPSVNAEIDGSDIIYKNYYDIGVAVGTEQGLVVPVVRNCDKLSLAEIEKEIGNLGKKAKDGKLSISDMQGGTFTISNGGVYGSLLSTPIINPPQSGILGLHNIVKRPVVVDDKIEIRPMMYIALSYDHRIIDGKEAVTFLVKIKELIEDPARLILDL